MKLSVEERAEAAKVLLDSLDDGDDDPEAEALKRAELVRRAQAVVDGTGELVEADEAQRRVEARLRQIRGA